MKRIYLDYNASTPMHPEVIKEIASGMTVMGNPSSIHEEGRQARFLIEKAREKVAQLLGVKSKEIIFTSGGSESDSLALMGVVYGNKKKKNHIVLSAIEHHAVLETAFSLEKNGCKISFVPCSKQGIVDLEKLSSHLTDQTLLVSIQSANNETGVCQPIEEIANLCKQKEIFFHSDIVQSIGKVPIDIKGLSLASLSAHKFYGPKGVGILFIKEGVPFERLIYGGNQEKGKRGGTENLLGIIGLAKALEISLLEMEEQKERQFRLIERLWESLADLPGIERVGDPNRRVPNTLLVLFSGLSGHDLLIGLDLAGIAASSGSACMSGTSQPSHVLMAMGYEPSQAISSVRFSIGKFTTEEEITVAAQRIREVVLSQQKALS
ncbi:cysteine desulfurase [Candidatus Methylacidiphilum fumarolicum]|uniref:cysteine desulfurase n=2 Tax=Candidatus Methylacidiphilum fumarolicum TaxID=591154 RepID=I0K1C3_METFB|nr:cysteine desulfurase family protein [Candidatus Methylacidiphilum fumarolicum]MBW6414952.1 cysteine desulfurase [Candidatus Methylacidiphilum fumarolicum]TFE70358.1 cysteine sulfinate desulfinase [Candidatus Methylacidiphilum fumarolicum]TFE73962.1 cysteine desulfurase [Candidatus Methylacidiphilum fumarolicum]TFE74468.1 cysteine desulfurase [Candidatus Methylacidiphilum fumarolicum]TFE77871.1 cysteine sulfinate desulfinase [Candidatus Methylacidiphilum fumarolicum]